MVEVVFACIPGVGGVECTLNGSMQVSISDHGIVSFMGVSQGAHSYSIKAPKGMVFTSGEDAFKRPLFQSGTTVIERFPESGEPWPEAQPWMMLFNFKEGEFFEAPEAAQEVPEVSFE